MTSTPNKQTTGNKKYYPPSYLDRFMNFIKRLPLPYWLTYLLLFLLQSTLMHILGWMTGWPAVYKIDPILFLFPLWQWVPLAIITYANSVSLQALSTFSPLLDVEEAELDKLKYEFSTMPSRGVILNSLFWGVIYTVLTSATLSAFISSYGMDSVVAVVIVSEGLLAYLTSSAIYYHSIRQLRLVDRTVRMARQFNVLQLDPAYAFSRLTSLIGVSWMVMLSLTLLTFPIRFIGGIVLGIMVLQLGLAVAAFVLPLWFVYRRINSEKLRLLAEHNRQVEIVSARLHRSLDENDMAPVTQLKDAMIALDSERGVLNAIPTWPWSSGTLTGFISATVLPILLYVIQLVIQKFMGN